MASWQGATEPHVKAGKLVVIGVVQEQHADRARLYRQWKRLEWPIFIDALNLRDLDAVPVPVGVDESGIVRLTGALSADAVREFVEKDFGKTAVPAGQNVAPKPDPKAAKSPRDRGDALFLHDPEGLDAAVEAYEKADPQDARALFRLGVALRARYDSPGRRPGDAQRAVEAWGAALALQPNKYIWRRRIQQFGPRLDKPYDFFFWVEEARRDILARGEKPVELAAEPMGSEIAPPSKGAPQAAAPAVPDPDPAGKLIRDKRPIVVVEPVVTPARVRPGERIRARVAFRLDPLAKAHWNNEADPLSLSVKPPAGVSIVEGTFTLPNPAKAESDELRILEFEAAVDAGVPAGKLSIPGYALYAVCEDKDGVCRYVRQDLSLTVVVDPKAVKLQ